MLQSIARLPTAHGAKYLQQLSKHFAHKIAVDLTETEARYSFSDEGGTAHLVADEEGLSVTLRAPEARALIQARYVIDKHLVTFAFRENFSGLPWQAAEEIAAD